ncbi:MAG TPA: MarR family transcriptional regulator [Candidatus Dormibacteraeota bacterium]|nr:MarR family transcriptional regulator [Candidatus Dormibacteraeota bacterium]
MERTSASLRAPSTATPRVAREQVAERLWALFPLLKQRLQATLPVDLNDELRQVTPHQLEALHHVLDLDARSGGGAAMNELARLQHCALSTATALVDRLIKQGLAERIADPTDRRVVRIAPTRRGEEFSRRFAEAKHDVALQMLAPLDDAELSALKALLEKVLQGSGADKDTQEAAG